MFDLKYIKENLPEIKKNIANRFMDCDIDELVNLFEARNRSITEIDSLRRSRNQNSAKMKAKMSNSEREELIVKGKQLKNDISEIEKKLNHKEEKLQDILNKLPNASHPDIPIGKEEKDNLEIRRFGEPTQFSFPPKDHMELADNLGIVDFEAGAKVTGPKFYYLKNQAVFLELGLCRYALDFLAKKGFTPIATPDIAKTNILEGIGFNPRGPESNVYNISDTDLCLIGTAEITLGGALADRILDEKELPIKLGGLSHCFRKEAGSAGQYSKGLYRVHQFTKIEMFVFCRPDDSDATHEELVGLEEAIFSSLEIPFRVVDTCTGDLGAPAYRKYDLEAWMPGRGDSGDWGEVTSTSNCTDYQARRLGIRYKDAGGKKHFVHMLNGTAIAVTRAIIAILENFQQADGSVKIPKALIPYVGFDKIALKSK